MEERFSFEGLSVIEGRLVRRAEDIGYIVLVDRTHPEPVETLGRFTFTTEDALPYLPGALLPEPGDVDDDRLTEDELPGFDLALHPANQPLPMRVIAHAAGRWIRGTASRNTVGESFRRFRVKVWSPKGAEQIDSGQFVCRNHGLDDDLPHDHAIANLKIPEPTFDAVALAGAARGMKALGDYYAQWGQIVLGSVGQLQGVNNQMLLKLHAQLQESRGQVDQLVGHILEFRIRQVEVDEEHKREEKGADARHDLAKEALQQIGDAARTFLTAKGVTPEMAEVVSVLGQSQDLVTVLQDPDVRELMKDPDNLKGLALMLRQTAAQARALREAAAAAAPKDAPKAA